MTAAVVLTASLVLLASGRASAAAPAGGLVPADLMAKARASGKVRVIAQLDLPATALWLPGGRLPVARRAAIAASRERLAERLAATRWELAREYETVPFVALEVGPEALSALETSGVVRGVVEDRLESPLLRESAPLVEADVAADLGFDGSGWTIAILDTGIDAGHPFLAGKVVAEACFSANRSCPNGRTTQYGSGAGAPCGYASNACRHGTHVAGIAAGSGSDFSGVARGANLIAVQVFSRLEGRANCAGEGEDPCARSYTSDTLAALEWVYSLRDAYRIAAVNMSLGGERYFSEAMCDRDEAARKEVIDNLRAAGTATVAAAGNDSYDDSLTAPACLSSVVSVSATTKTDQMASFSNSASFLDLLAPGVSILSSLPPDDFAEISGTSQATPHVAAAFAILDQRLGAASVDTALAALESTGLPVYDSRNGLTRPRIRIAAALDTLPSTGSPSGLQITPDAKRTLVSKDVDGDRWAITSHDGGATVTGNVFRPGGGEPEFVYCERTGSDGNPDPYAEQIFFSCWNAGNCTSLSCPTGQWTFSAEVKLPGAFLLPPSSTQASGGAGVGPEEVAGGGATSALQITPDGLRTLVSKDVGGERWAITRNADDDTVTGNVYPLDGGDPKFVWCELVGTNGDPNPSTVLLTYGCSTAGRCTTPTCSPEEWAFYTEVTIPGSFFEPR